MKVELKLETLKGLHDRFKDMRPALEQIADRIRQAYKENFEKGGRPNHWAPLSPVTIQIKEELKNRGVIKRGRSVEDPTKILVRYGFLRSSYIDKTDKDHVEEVDASKNEVAVGSKLRYAMKHQTGREESTFTREYEKSGVKQIFMRHIHSIPIRPQELTDQDKIEIKEIVHRYLTRDQKGGRL